MITIILAGGLGTRIAEETEFKPKPMVLINGKPLLWHVMSIYARQGHSEFVIATGFKGEIIHRWVAELQESWNVRALDTGENTQTGGRVKQCIQAFPANEYLATYGDGLGNVALGELLKVHRTGNPVATLTAVRPPARFGSVKIDGVHVNNFGEKNQADEGWINGGFFMMQREIVDYIDSDSEPLETGALTRLANLNRLNAYKHSDFWQPMDTLREKLDLENLALSTPVPWLQGI